MSIDKKSRVQGSNDEERLPSGAAIGRHARTSRSSTHVTEGKCPRSRSPTPPPRARFSSPSTCAIDAVFTTSRPRDGVTGSNGSSVAIGRSEVWMGGRSTSHYSRNRGEAQSFEDHSLPAFDGYDDRTTEPTTGPTTTTRRAHCESDATDGNNLKRVSRFFAHSRPKTTRRNATIVRAEGEAAAVREIRSIRAPLGWISSFEFPNRPRTARRRAREFLTRLNEIKFVPRD
jgi:hypothetical protein